MYIQYGYRHPNGTQRVTHTIHGEVIKHTTQVTGVWFWKKQVPAVVVALRDEDRIRLRDICCAIGMPSPQKDLTVTFKDEAERDTFSVGDNVVLKFSTLCQFTQCFYRVPAFQWEGFEKEEHFAA